MYAALIDTLSRQALIHRRALLLYLCLLSASMGLAASVSAIVPPRHALNVAACVNVHAASCTAPALSAKR